MKRNIIEIDEQKCNGCGLCVQACHEGALQLIDGKARLVSESYCDGLGDCLPACPTGAIVIEEREAPAYDEEAVKKHIAQNKTQDTLACGCPGTHARSIARKSEPAVNTDINKPVQMQSELAQWPCQIRLVPPAAPYFEGARLLVAADCTAYAYANFHRDLMKGRVTIIGCPKLDNTDYSEKLAEILKRHDIKSVTVARMEVPCCGGIENAVKKALLDSGKMIPWNVVTIGTDGSYSTTS